ncbi:MAG: hypothetical protein EXS09_01255 [Gemmataceae bacterium]|nr:hypothetical protein [Gemmataceae bacterium]
MHVRRCVGRAMILVLACNAFGCSGGNLNQANFERLKVGMSAQQVESILGKGGKEIPSSEVAALMKEALGPQDGKSAGMKLDVTSFSGAKGIRWGDDKKFITVIFMSDRASRIFKKGF